MQVYYGFESVQSLCRPVAAIGSFDGVHKGHRRILHYLCDAARELSGQSVVVTFNPHPQTVLRPNSDFFQINSLEKNLHLIEEAGVDATVVIPFDVAFSQLSHVEFLEKYMIEKLQVCALVMGPNHAFGHHRAGNHNAIGQLCQQRNVQVIDIPELMIHDSGVHSARIRKLITSGDFPQVDELLGYHYENNKTI